MAPGWPGPQNSTRPAQAPARPSPAQAPAAKSSGRQGAAKPASLGGEKLGAKGAPCVKVGPVWITIGPRIEAEITALKKFMEDLSKKVDGDGKCKARGSEKPSAPEARRPAFQPPARKPGVDVPSRSGGVALSPKPTLQAPRSKDGSALLHFDKLSGMLFQLPAKESRGMAFTATEIGTTLAWAQKNPGQAGQIAFSLDPVDAKSWQERGDTAEGLYQRKWYSETSLRDLPLGYWMWRADWKLKQLSQGMLHDDATGQQRPLRPGVDVPFDFPEAAQGDQGCARLWLVCRSVVRRPVGRSALLIHPDDVQMGCEVRAQTFNPRTNCYEDAKETQPHTSAARVAEYLSVHYDAVAKYVPELHHCKRMAALLSVAHWLLENHVGPKQLAPEACIAAFSVPQDFPDSQVPALCAVHEQGLGEETIFRKADKELQDLLAQAHTTRGEKHIHLEKMKMAVDKQKDLVETSRRKVDQYSSTSVAAFNAEVQKYNQLVEEHTAAAESHNTFVASIQQKLDVATKKRNDAALACNAVRTTCIFVGGVDLHVGGKVEVKPLAEKSEPVDRQVRSWADELRRNENVSALLAGRPPKGLPRSLPEEIQEERKAAFNVFPIAVAATAA